MAKVKNILFIMADQLRADYLSCYGHPHIETPALDALAARGVLFKNAYLNATVCGPSRMSYYTGRYMSSHGSTWNTVPLRVGEPTLGDHLRMLGVNPVLVGKTHMAADYAGMARLGMSFESIEGVLSAECGFFPFERDDGLHPGPRSNADLRYNRYLREMGYDDPNPWESVANSAKGRGAKTLSGWHMRNAAKPARVAEEHSETAYMTNAAMEFMRDAGDAPWCLHLSYIKPHWPYIAPKPYHRMYGPEDVIPANRTKREKKNPHPVYGAYMRHTEGMTFSDEKVRTTVIPVYMGLIRQIDDHLAKLFKFLEDQGLADKTMIVFCSDHGDYLGDHWLGEKELFHDAVVRTPLIIFDPDEAADATRGKVEDRLVQAIDLAPSFCDLHGAPPLDHILEGRSLLPLTRGGEWDARDAVISELDYSFRAARTDLGVAADKARAYMVRTKEWKYIFFEGFRPQLFDLKADPKERNDLGADPKHARIRKRLYDRLFEWSRSRKMHITERYPPPRPVENGSRYGSILIGEW
jgi:arylsulfatase A-like enzyme